MRVRRASPASRAAALGRGLRRCVRLSGRELVCVERWAPAGAPQGKPARKPRAAWRMARSPAGMVAWI